MIANINLYDVRDTHDGITAGPVKMHTSLCAMLEGEMKPSNVS